MKKLVIYRCKHCKNVAIKLVDKMVPMFCCGEQMEILNANTTDGAMEKHVPKVSIKNGICTVEVGEVLHPMLDEHYIQFVIVNTNMGYYVKDLMPGQSPVANFALLENEKVEEVYEYCNLHGLWKVEL